MIAWLVRHARDTSIAFRTTAPLWTGVRVHDLGFPGQQEGGIVGLDSDYADLHAVVRVEDMRDDRSKGQY